jgi:putative heme iron utilization protein
MTGQRNLAETVVALLREVTRLEDILFVVENGSHAIVEGWVDPKGTNVEAQENWVAVESHHWHCHLDVGAVTEIRFIEEPDVHDLKRRAFGVRLLEKDGSALLMIFFGKMYDEAGVLSQDQVGRFKTLREKYG